MSTYCKKCGIEKTEENTSPHPKMKDRLQRFCKACSRDIRKEHYQNNKKNEQIKRKGWQENNRKLHNKHARDYYQNHKEEISRRRKKERLAKKNVN